MGTGTGAGTETRAVAEMGRGTRMGTGTRTRTGSRRAEKRQKKRKEPQNSCRRHVGNWGDLGGDRKTRRQERVYSVVANLDNLGNSKETGE